MDPDSVKKDPRISENFALEVNVSKLCDKCTSAMAVEELCAECTQALFEELDFWRLIAIILKGHSFPSHEEGVMMNFNSNVSDYEQVLAKAEEKSSFKGEKSSLQPNEETKASVAIKKSKTEGYEEEKKVYSDSEQAGEATQRIQKELYSKQKTEQAAKELQKENKGEENLEVIFHKGNAFLQRARSKSINLDF